LHAADPPAVRIRRFQHVAGRQQQLRVVNDLAALDVLVEEIIRELPVAGELGKHVARVYYKDLEVDSPYNTYKHKGLPPGPIASPGRPSIEAALYPASVPYEYFVAFPDGHHEFRRDLAGHEQARLEARRAWDSVDVVRRPDGVRPK